MSKICKDCKHCEPVEYSFLFFKSVDYKYSKCLRDGAIDLVTGKGGRFCSMEREYDLDQNCKKEGKYWEPK